MQKIIMKEYVGNVKEYEETRGKYEGICRHMWKIKALPHKSSRTWKNSELHPHIGPAT